MEPKFSIIVPIYKVGQYLEECLQSLIVQETVNYEIILVDDGSPDNCPAICDEFASKNNITRVIHKKNGGLVSARKAGALLAKGEYICCVDGDDFISSEYLKTITEIVDNYNPDVICFDYYKYSSETSIKANSYANLVSGLYDKNMISKAIFPSLIADVNGGYFLPTVWSKVYKRQLYFTNQMSVDDKITMGEDGACTIPIMYQANTIYLCDEPLYYYRLNNESMTKGHKRYDWENQLLIAKQLYNAIDCKKFDFQDQMYRRIARGFFNTAKSQFNQKSKYKVVKRDIIEHMKAPLFEGAINNCHFNSSMKTRLIEICLKKRFVFLMYLLNLFSI